MDENFNQIIKCECGKDHFINTKNIVVGDDALEKLIDSIDQSGLNQVLIFTTIKANNIVSKIRQSFNDKYSFEIFFLPENADSVMLAESLEFKEHKLIVAIGGEKVISVAKYYAYCYDSEIFVYAIDDFIDFTFSKYSRLYDGVVYNFYETASPSQIFVSIPKRENVFQSYYIASKYLAIFDNVVRGLILKEQNCKKLQAFLKETLLNYKESIRGQNNVVAANIWTLIRLGQAMTFYNETKSFFGGDKAVCDLLQSVYPDADYLEISSLTSKLIINSYSCFYKLTPASGNVNLNKHIKALSTLLQISPTEVMNRVASGKFLSTDEETIKTFKSYYPYLKGVLGKVLGNVLILHSRLSIITNVIKKYNIQPSSLEKAIACSPLFCKNFTTINLLFKFGYLDKLL